MVVVVPTFAKRDQGEPRVVAAVIGSVETAGAEAMRKRIDGDGGVEQDHGRDKEPPGYELSAGSPSPGAKRSSAAPMPNNAVANNTGISTS